MTRLARRGVALAGLLPSLFIATLASADRPNFGDLETRLQQVETQQARTIDAVCSQYDSPGQTYRPFVCDPRCDCLEDSTVAAFGSGGSCTQSSLGNYSATTTWSGTCLSTQQTCQDLDVPGDQYCLGSYGQSLQRVCQEESSGSGCDPADATPCPDPSESCELIWYDPLFPAYSCLHVCQSDADCTPPAPTVRSCTLSSFRPCETNLDCAEWAGETCHYPTTISGSSGVCVTACAVDADCPQFALTCDNISGKSCGGGGPCPDGEDCQLDPQSGFEYCGIACQTDADCNRPLTVTIQGATNSDVTEPVSCRVVGQDDCGDGCQINGADAITCVASIEAALGQACSTPP